MPESAAFAELEIALRMREYRAASGMTSKAASELLGFSQSYLSALEHGREQVSMEKLDDLAVAYGLSADEIEELAAHLAVVKAPRWWEESQYSRHLNDETMVLCGLESGAKEIDIFEGQVFTGLLQTRAYARALIMGDPETSPASIEGQLSLRARRQELLEGGTPPRLRLLIGQSVLMIEVGGRDVLKGQLEHVIEMLDAMGERLEVRIQPFALRSVALLAASTLMFFRAGEGYKLGPVVWREAAAPLSVVNSPEQVELLVIRYEEALSASLTPEETRELLLKRVSELS